MFNSLALMHRYLKTNARTEAKNDVTSGKKMGSGERCVAAIIIAAGSLDEGCMNDFYIRLVQELQLKDARPFDEVVARFLKGKIIEPKSSWDGRWLGFAGESREPASISVLNVDATFRPIVIRFLEIVAHQGGQVMDIVGGNFIKHYGTLPQAVRTAYDAVLAGARIAGHSFVNAIVDNLNALPAKTQDRLVELLLASKDEAAQVATRIVERYDALPAKVRRLLGHFVDVSNYSEHDEVPHTSTPGIARAIINNYDHLPGDARDLLTVLAKKDEDTLKSISWILVHEYLALPGISQEALGRVVKANADLSKWALVYFVDDCHETPERSIDLILALLEGNSSLKRFLAAAVLDPKAPEPRHHENFLKLPKHVQNLVARAAGRD
jgi:hypothetical protein